MKYVFLGILGFFVVLYVIAESTLEQPPADGTVRLTWATDDNPARKIQCGTFARLYPGHEVSVDPSTLEKNLVRCATGTGPDILDVYNVQQMSTYVQAGVLLDLTPYAAQMGFGVENTYPALRDGLRVEGRQYRFPCNVWANCVIYNKQIFDDHGLAYPKEGWTYADFLRVAHAIADTPGKSGEKHIAVANYNPFWFVGDILFGLGGRFYSPDGLTSMLDSPEAIQAMALYHRLMHDEKVIPTPADAAAMSAQGGWGSGGLTWFGAGRAAMIFIGRWYIILVNNYPDIKGHLGAVRLPRLGDRPSSGMCDTRAAGINAKSPNAQAALQFLQYLAGEDYSKVIVNDGDALPPNPRFARTGADLSNKIIPDPAFHQPFIDAMKHARPVDTSPFIDAGLVERWFRERLGEVENQLVPPADAMRSLAKEVNQQIRISLERRPDLQRKYAQVTGRPYTTDWWTTHQKH
ncbi:extracellular solute-binding protein [bacterium]|nr:extracellular solute-binding protein [bacterium]